LTCGDNVKAIHIPAKVNDRQKKTGTVIHLDEDTCCHFTEKIKYLGSIITWDLRDEINISTRIAMGHCTITRMKELFNYRDVSIGIKIIMYHVIPLNTALRGCESWALKEKEMVECDV
jgi:hypothetical protein